MPITGVNNGLLMNGYGVCSALLAGCRPPRGLYAQALRRRPHQGRAGLYPGRDATRKRRRGPRAFPNRPGTPPPRAHTPGAAAVGCHDRRSGRKIRRVRAAVSRAPRTPRAAKMRAGFLGGGAGWRRATSRPPWTSSRRFAPHDSYTIVVWLRCGFDRRHNQCAIKIISM